MPKFKLKAKNFNFATIQRALKIEDKSWQTHGESIRSYTDATRGCPSDKLFAVSRTTSIHLRVYIKGIIGYQGLFHKKKDKHSSFCPKKGMYVKGL